MRSWMVVLGAAAPGAGERLQRRASRRSAAPLPPWRGRARPSRIDQRHLPVQPGDFVG